MSGAVRERWVYTNEIDGAERIYLPKPFDLARVCRGAWHEFPSNEIEFLGRKTGRLYLIVRDEVGE